MHCMHAVGTQVPDDHLQNMQDRLYGIEYDLGWILAACLVTVTLILGDKSHALYLYLRLVLNE